jgi:hypothetical protein
MDTPEKNLAEIAWNSINPHCQGIDDHLTPQGIRNWSSAMTAVKAAVLAELPEFVLVHPSEAMPGDEWMKFSGCEWTKVRGGELFADFIPVRRRLHSSSPTEETPVGTPEELHPPVEATPHQGTDAPRAEWKPKYAVGDPVIWVTGDERTPATVVHVLPDQSCEIRLESSTSVRVKEHCLEPAPWKLPEPPEGHQWHRTDGWTQEMLPEGRRPMLHGEIGPCEMLQRDGTWKPVKAYQEAEPCVPQHPHTRTRRPLPTPPVPQPEDATAYWRGEYAQLQQRMNEVCVQRDSATSLADELKVKLAAAAQRAEEEDGYDEALSDLQQKLQRAERHNKHAESEWRRHQNRADEAESQLASLHQQLTAALARAEGADKLLKECAEKLDNYANRQGSRRLAKKSLSEGLVDNSVNKGQHYPAIQSLIDMVNNFLKSRITQSPQDGKTEGGAA